MSGDRSPITPTADYALHGRLGIGTPHILADLLVPCKKLVYTELHKGILISFPAAMVAPIPLRPVVIHD